MREPEENLWITVLPVELRIDFCRGSRVVKDCAVASLKVLWVVLLLMVSECNMQ